VCVCDPNKHLFFLLDKKMSGIPSHILVEAKNDDAHAQWQVGRAYEKGMYGLEANRCEAVEWYTKAAMQGHAMAEGTLADYFYNGGMGGVKENEGYAFLLWQLAASHGEVRAMGDLGFCYAYGKGTKQDREKALTWMQRGKALGGEECSVLYLCKTFPEWYPPDRHIHPRTFTQPSAMFILASMYEDGQCGLPKNMTMCFCLTERAAILGDAEAQYRLCGLYLNVEKDDERAMYWLRKSAEGGYGAAQSSLGYHLGNGTCGMKKNPQEAIKWLTRSAQQGDAHGQFNLATRYDSQDEPGVAFHWYTQAAINDLVDAQYNTAWCYSEGEGTIRNHSMYVYWLRRAALNGDKQSQEELCSIDDRRATLFDVKEAKDWI
jgi:uncharacterized protein